MSDSKTILKLFATFFKIGAFTFGGGHAMIPLIRKEVAEKNGMITDEEVVDMIAISESTPGPVAVNMATFVGYKVGGFMGAAVSTLGVVLPSFVIISIISRFLNRFSELEAVRFAFMGIRAAVLVLVINALVTIFKHGKRGVLPYIIMVSAFVATAVLNFSVPLIILAGAAVGIASFLIAGRQRGGEK